MQHNAPLAEQMQRLLEPLSPQWVAEQLGVTPQHVNHWKHGRHVSEVRLEEAADAVRRLLPEHRPGDPPPWAADLEARLEQLMTRDELTDYVDRAKAEVVSEIADGRTELIEAIAERAAELARQQLSRQSDDEAHGGMSGQQLGPRGPRPAPTP